MNRDRLPARKGHPPPLRLMVDSGGPGSTAKVRAVRRGGRPGGAGRPHRGSGCRSKRVTPAGGDGLVVDRGFQPSGIVQRARGGPLPNAVGDSGGPRASFRLAGVAAILLGSHALTFCCVRGQGGVHGSRGER